MKKFKNLFLFSAILLLFTGCGKTNEELLKEASENMTKLDNYHITLNNEMTLEDNEKTNYNSEIDVNNKDNVIYNKTIFDGDPEKTSQVYYANKDGNNLEFVDQYGLWYKSKWDYKKLIDFSILSDIQNVEKISNDDGKVLKFKLSKDQINRLITNIVFESETVDVEATIKDKNITKLVIASQTDYKGDDASSQIVMTITKFNENNGITLPQEVIDYSIDKDLEEAQMNIYNYIYEVESYARYGEISDGDFTGSNLIYTMVEPTKVELKIENSKVVSGFVELDGYRGTITDGYVDIKSLD